jgi:hypothetical protein
VIGDWFCFLQSTKAKFRILDDITYDFDESGFEMGVTSTGAVATYPKGQAQPKTVQQDDRG